MRPVYQTTFGGEDAPLEEKGNCWSACIASILEMPIAAVPNFHVLTAKRNISWPEATNAWLHENGLWLFGAGWTQEWEDDYASRHAGYYILTGQSPRGFWRHSVVFEAGGIVHDPAAAKFPDGPRLLPTNDEIPWEVEVLVPIEY